MTWNACFIYCAVFFSGVGTGALLFWFGRAIDTPAQPIWRKK